MLFNSLEFLVFLIVVFGIYWATVKSYKLQNLLLLVASYIFYGWWDWRFLFLIAGCSVVNFAGGLLIDKYRAKIVRRVTLTICLIASLFTLGFFKYYNFFAENLAGIMALLGINADFATLNIVLPVGISFFTFQALSYTIDIAFGKLKATKDPIEFFAFISFFPQLVAGPIERATNLLPQFGRKRTFDCATALDGLTLIAYGLFKKMVVADTLSMYVDNAFRNPGFYSSITCLLAAVFFAIQIYCDFSGYSDAARGLAKLFGFELMVNFNRPYMATSFADFWRRWHISLSSWFKDYVYIPLGGNRGGFARTIRNLWIVFLLSGLWHGASWMFVGWGALHAVFLTLGVVRRKVTGVVRNEGLVSRIRSILIVDVGVVFAWILFRAGSLDVAKDFFSALFACKIKTSLMALCAGIGPMSFLFCLIAVGLFLVSHFVPDDCKFKSMPAKIGFVLVCATAIVFFGMPSGGEFIYFQF